MNQYVLLGAAILSELIRTTSFKLSEGFSRPLPSLVVSLGYGAAFYFLSLTLEKLPIGVVYGTWAALGIVGIAAIGAILFNEQVDFAGVVGGASHHHWCVLSQYYLWNVYTLSALYVEPCFFSLLSNSIISTTVTPIQRNG